MNCMEFKPRVILNGGRLDGFRGVMNGIIFSDETEGASDHDACRNRRGSLCKCPPCAVCGWGEHDAIHGPHYGQPPGSKPWGHKYRTAKGMNETYIRTIKLLVYHYSGLQRSAKRTMENSKYVGRRDTARGRYESYQLIIRDLRRLIPMEATE